MPDWLERPPDQLPARLCAVAAVLMLAVLAASAALRLGHAGCADTLLPPAAVTAARAIHRIAASLVGVLLLAIAGLAMRRRPLPPAIVLPLAGAGAATVFLAVLGRASAGSTTPLVVIGNVVAGVLLYVLLRHLQLQFRQRPPAHPCGRRLRGAAAAARAMGGIQVWLGAWAAGMAAQAAGCRNALAGIAGSLAGSADGLRRVQLLHEVSALALLLLAVPLMLYMRGTGGDRRRDANRLAIVLAIQACLGIFMVFTDVSPGAGAAHNVLAAIALGILVRIDAGLRRA